VAYGGRPLDVSKLNSYDKWALNYFSDRRVVVDPNCEITIQLDITDAERFYRAKMASTPGASLTAYLTWSLLRAIAKHPCFSWRSVNGKWYEFGDLPVFIPVSTGKENRFQDVLIEGATRLGWKEFCEVYRRKIDDALQGKAFDAVPDDIFKYAFIIGNMRQLAFTSLRVFIQSYRTGRPAFYFGRRYESEERLRVPFYALMDHSTAEPERLDVMIGDYLKLMMGSA
jgi:chloramphenicol O-acetyltransferase